MAIPIDHFIESLDASGLMSSAQTSVLREEHAVADGETIASELVARGLLTEYQAEAICTDQVTHLVLGDYTIVDKIGEGGMGQVFKGLHKRLDRFAAIKILSSRALDDRKSIERFYQEVKIAAQITHPNIVITHDAGEHNGIHYLVMEYIDGQDIDTLLAEHGPLPVSEALSVTMQTAKGLEYAHRRQIVHRDIKPSNLLLDQQGHVKILDMGLARMSGSTEQLEKTANERLTNPGQVMGTLDYMSPEQAENARIADARSDIYSLGCSVFRMLTGKVPYPSESVVESIMSHREATIPSLRTCCAEAPEWLDDVVRTCINKRPEDRYQSASELIRSMEQHLNTSGRVDGFAAKVRRTFSHLGALATSEIRNALAITNTQNDADHRKARVHRGASPEHTGREENARAYKSKATPVGPGDDRAQLPPQAFLSTTIHDNPLRKHRGKRILMLGGLGLLISPWSIGAICGLVATVMGRADLHRMRNNRMNARGRNTTVIGMALGLCAILRWALGGGISFLGI